MSTAIGSPTENLANTGTTTVTESQAPKSRLTQSSSEPDRILVSCPHCETVLSVRRIYIGERVRCKKCTQMFLLPPAVGSSPVKVYDGTFGVPASDSEQTGVNAAKERPVVASNGLLDQLAKLVTSYDELRSVHDHLQTQHIKVQTDRDEICNQLRYATDELSAIRTQLGAIAPADVQPVASERDALRVEVTRLRDDNQALFAERSKHEAQIAQLEKQALELDALRDERDALAAMIKSREVELHTVRADHDALAKELSSGSAALVAANTELCRLRQQLEQSENDLIAGRRERDETNHQLELCKNEFASIRADLARLNSEQQNASATIEQLKKTVAERDQLIAGERDQFRAELECNQEALASAEKMHRDERERLGTELAAQGAKYERLRDEHRSAEQLCAWLQTKNAESTAAHEQLVAEYQVQLESERAKQRQLADEILQVRANSAETDRAVQALISSTLNSPIAHPASPEELEAARLQAEDLKRGLAESERVNRMLAESLDSMGIHINLPGRPRNVVSNAN